MISTSTLVGLLAFILFFGALTLNAVLVEVASSPSLGPLSALVAIFKNVVAAIASISDLICCILEYTLIFIISIAVFYLVYLLCVHFDQIRGARLPDVRAFWQWLVSELESVRPRSANHPVRHTPRSHRHGSLSRQLSIAKQELQELTVEHNLSLGTINAVRQELVTLQGVNLSLSRDNDRLQNRLHSRSAVMAEPVVIYQGSAQDLQVTALEKKVAMLEAENRYLSGKVASLSSDPNVTKLVQSFASGLAKLNIGITQESLNSESWEGFVQDLPEQIAQFGRSQVVQREWLISNNLVNATGFTGLHADLNDLINLVGYQVRNSNTALATMAHSVAAPTSSILDQKSTLQYQLYTEMCDLIPKFEYLHEQTVAGLPAWLDSMHSSLHMDQNGPHYRTQEAFQYFLGQSEIIRLTHRLNELYQPVVDGDLGVNLGHGEVRELLERASNCIKVAVVLVEEDRADLLSSREEWSQPAPPAEIVTLSFPSVPAALPAEIVPVAPLPGPVIAPTPAPAVVPASAPPSSTAPPPPLAAARPVTTSPQPKATVASSSVVAVGSIPTTTSIPNKSGPSSVAAKPPPPPPKPLSAPPKGKNGVIAFGGFM